MAPSSNETSSLNTPSTPSTRRRWLKRLLLLIPAVLLLAILLGVLSLRSHAVRQTILGRLSQSLEPSTCVRARIDDFKLDITGGTLELDGIVLATGDAPPFLTAKSARAEFDWRQLFSDPKVLKRVSLVDPVVDLRKPLPGPSTDADGGEPIRIDVHQFSLIGGRLLGTGPELIEWSADNIDVAGTFIDGRVDLRLEPAQVHLERPGEAPIDALLTSRLKGPLAGPYTFDDLKVTGRGLTLEASGEVGTADDQPRRVRVDFDADPSLLLQEIGPGGNIKARGEFDLRTFQGDLHVVAKGFPTEALQPWIGEAARPGGQPSRIDFEAQFHGDPDAPQQVTGEADLVWHQDDQTLAQATVHLTDGRLDKDGVVLESLVGDVVATAGDVPVELLRPWLGRDNLDLFAARGTRLDLDAEFRVGASAPSEPEGHLDLVWRRGSERLLEASARTLETATPNTVGAEIHLEYEASILPAEPGKRQISGQLLAASWYKIASGELADARLDLDLPDVAETADDLGRRWPRLMSEAGLQADGWPEFFRGHLNALTLAQGPIRSPSIDLEATWQPEATARVHVVASGQPAALFDENQQGEDRRGEARLTLEHFDLAWLPGPGPITGTVSGTLETQGSLDDWTTNAVLDASDLRYGVEAEVFEELHLRATGGPTGVEITSLTGRAGPSKFEGHGGVVLAQKLLQVAPEDLRIQSARLSLKVDAPLDGIDHLDFDAELADGVVQVTRLELEAPTGPGDLVAEIPLGAFRALDLDVDAWPVEVAEGRIKVDLGFPQLDLDKLVTDVGQESPWTAHTASLTGRLWIDPFDLPAAEGELLVEHWLLEVQDGTSRHRLEVGDDPILMALDDGRLDVLPVTLQADGNSIDLEGAALLSPDWTLEKGFEALVRHVEATADGTIDSGLLTPYLAGGVAEGPVQINAELSGSPAALEVHIVADGPRAAILYASPYMTQIQGWHVDVMMSGDEIAVSKATGQLNGGPLTANAARTPEGDWRAAVQFESARFQLDYGLTTVLHGDLRLDLPLQGTGNLAGGIEVERAVQRRDLKLDREILDALFAPPDITGAGDSGLDLALNIEVTTARGVWIKNNLADLRANWGTLTVQGTAENPAIKGRIDIDPGGFLYAYGQTARIDQGAMIWTGEPGLPPQLEFQPTWDSQDPTVAASDPLQQLLLDWGPTIDESNKEVSGVDDRLVDGLTGFVGGRLAQNLAGARVRIQPVLVFGETDPSAKLVISRDLSAWIAFAVAVDLRDSQNQTYVLNVHQLRRLPPVAFQLFTRNGQTEGVTVQQTLKFGRGRKNVSTQQARLRRVYFETVLDGISLKGLRKAIGYSKGDFLPEEAEFEVEVTLAEHLRGLGYPGARVDVILEPAGRKTADLSIAIGPGPHVDFQFEGTEIPRGLRRTVSEPYRVDFYERTSLTDVENQAIRALRSQGYSHPKVEIEVVQDPGNRRDRTVILRAEGGEKLRLNRLRFEGVDEETADLLESRFTTLVARIELAAAEPRADQWLVKSLRSFGYPSASIRSRRISDDGHELAVSIDVGPRQEIAALEIRGLNATDAEAYLKHLPLSVGQAPRSDRVATGNLLIHNHLKRRGHTEVRVHTSLEPVAEGSSKQRLVYEVEPGPQYHLESIRFTGLNATRPKWARKVAELETAAVLDPEVLGQSRRLLVSTRLFQSVRTVTDRSPDGQAHVTFEVEEAPRYEFAYGVRWESDDEALAGAGSSLVLDVLDRNVLGRGITLGLRGLYGGKDQAGRLYARRAGLFGRRLSLEAFIEQRHEETRPTQDFVDDSLLTDTTLGSLQVAFPIGNLTSQVYGRFKRSKIREKTPFDPFFPFEEDIRFPFVGWQLVYDRRDDRIAPTRGIFASTDLSVTGDYINSDFDFVRLFTQFQWTRPVFRLGSRQFTWAQSYRVGLFTSQDDFPLSDELFVAGGERSVRGYPFESLAADGRGGEALLVINQELRFSVWRELGGVVFFDFGNAWTDKGDFGSDLFKSLGLGVRAQTPIGLLRLDFGYPLDTVDGDPTIKTYFGFGHAF